MSKTTIILSNLNREDFLSNTTYSEYSNESRLLSFVDRLKLDVLNLSPGVVPEPDYYLKRITHWSNLPFLHRVIIIVSEESVATRLFGYLQEVYLLKNDHIRVSLQENLLQRSKSTDGLQLVDDLSKFKQDHYFSSSGSDAGEKLPQQPASDGTFQYTEPRPKHFDVYNDLAKLGIDLSSLNDTDQLNELKASPNPQKPTLLRTKSLTKTLFKPDLQINTTCSTSNSMAVPQSPTITLDESP